MSEELVNQEIDRKKAEIAALLNLDKSYIQFQFAEENGKTLLKLITINPRHQQTFLLHTTEGFGQLDAIKAMLEYAKSLEQTKHTFTVQWSRSNEDELHTSYFRGKTLYEVLDKFYYGKEISDTIIFSISLNPLS